MVAVVRVVPEKRALVRICALEFGHEAGAVEVLLWDRLQAGHGEDSGEKIRRTHWLIADAVGLGDSGPLDEERFANAAFVGPAFAGAERQVGGGRTLGSGEPSVVGGENDDRVIVEFQLGEFVEDAADILIKVLNHRRVVGAVLNLPHRAAVVIEELGGFTRRELGRLGFIFFQQSGFGLKRGVDGVVGEVNEKRLVAVLLDEADRLVGEAVSEVFAFWSIRQVREFIWAEIGWGSPLVAASEVELEALVFGPM